MSRRDKRGRRTGRLVGTRDLLPGRFLIVTDASATEKNYFLGMYNMLTSSEKHNITLKVIPDISTNKLVEKCIELRNSDPNFGQIWIVFDRDKVPNFDHIIREAEAKGIRVAWSNPCFEIWAHAYFENMLP